MPDTINALLVVLFAVLPGIPGNAIYKRLIGSDWREDQWKTVVRIIGISLGGLIAYIILGSLINAPLPSYIIPSTFKNFEIQRPFLMEMSISLLGHFISATLVGFLGAKTTQLLDKIMRVSDNADSWHKFVSLHARERWVVVSLHGGAAYAGYIDRADTNVKADERDLILAEPASYQKDTKKYLSLPHQYLFLPGKMISSIAIVAKQSDERITKIHKYLFQDTDSQGGKNA